MKKFVVKVNIVVMAKTKKEAREKIELQLAYTSFGNHPLDSSNVVHYDEDTKIQQVVEMTHNGKKWIPKKK